MPLDIRTAIMALLENGASSFAAVYGFLVREERAPASVEFVWGELRALEEANYVSVRRMTPDGRWEAPSQAWRSTALDEYRDWLSELGPDELSTDALGMDEVGLWYAITEKGRQMMTEPSGASPLWSVDLDIGSGCVVVHAANEACAQQVLEDWQNKNPNLIDEERISMSTVDSYRLRSGTMISPATRIVALLRGPRSGVS